MSLDVQLAIVIPAYKSDFLVEALTSLHAQTNKRFRVYVGDDASPAPIGDICNSFRTKLDISYYRFPENLGQKSLIDQWNRCVQLSSEPWVWIFSDDDLIEPGCVEAFYAAIEESMAKFDLYRFNTLTINNTGQAIQISPPHPPVESGLEFAYHRLCGNRASFVSEYIFSRKVFNQRNGMVNFPLAWCSDDASWISFAGSQGIYTIYGPKVLWRQSEVNISFTSTPLKGKKIEACALFLEWINDKFDPDTIERELKLDLNSFNECCTGWLLSHLTKQAPLGPSIWGKILKDQRFSCFGSPANKIYTLACINLSLWKSQLLLDVSSFLKKFIRPASIK